MDQNAKSYSTINRSRGCHPERSEGSVATCSEMLRCAQHDSIITPTASRGCHPERSEGPAEKLTTVRCDCSACGPEYGCRLPRNFHLQSRRTGGIVPPALLVRKGS